MSTTVIETPEPESVDSAPVIVVADTGGGGDDETAREVGRLTAENAELRARLESVEQAQALTDLTADLALGVADDAAETATAAVELATPDPEPEPEPDPPEHDDPPAGKHPFHKSWAELKGH